MSNTEKKQACTRLGNIAFDICKGDYAEDRRKFLRHIPGDAKTEEIVARLFEHYAKLKIFTEANADVGSKLTKLNSAEKGNEGDIIAYRLAATDLFVEKSLEYLRDRAKRYKFWGFFAYTIGALAVIFAVFVAGCKFIDGTKNFGQVTSSEWIPFLTHFVAAFTFYGLLVVFAVTAWRFGKAMFDQSERIYEKRHAMRQGRLYVHLKRGEINIEELERAFTWNVSKENAFSTMQTDAKAPIGAAITDIANSLKASADALKAVSDAARPTKNSQ